MNNPECACLNSKINSPECFDTGCTNLNSLRTTDMFIAQCNSIFIQCNKYDSLTPEQRSKLNNTAQIQINQTCKKNGQNIETPDELAEDANGLDQNFTVWIIVAVVAAVILIIIIYVVITSVAKKKKKCVKRELFFFFLTAMFLK